MRESIAEVHLLTRICCNTKIEMIAKLNRSLHCIVNECLHYNSGGGVIHVLHVLNILQLDGVYCCFADVRVLLC